MGYLSYGDMARVRLDDRLLAHLQLVITTKLRRGESFTFTWRKSPADGGGRSSIWLHPSLPIVFDFEGSRAPSINRHWMELLMDSAESTTGLEAVAEPKESDVRRGGSNVFYAAVVTQDDPPSS